MKKKLGQHLLADQQILAQLIAEIAPKPADNFVEVGPGTGQLTEPLLASGAAVRALELDSKYADTLSARVGQHASRLEVFQGDAVKDLHIPATEDWRLVGNLPYQISSPLLIKLCDLAKPPQDVHVMVQLEFAQRAEASAGSKAYGRLTVFLQAVYSIEILFQVPPNAFKPMPQVDSAVIRMCPLANPLRAEDPKLFAEIVTSAFGQKRKMLGNSLGNFAVAAGQFAGMRAEQLTVADFVQITNDYLKLT